MTQEEKHDPFYIRWLQGQGREEGWLSDELNLDHTNPDGSRVKVVNSKLFYLDNYKRLVEYFLRTARRNVDFARSKASTGEARALLLEDAEEAVAAAERTIRENQ